ncbi:hypothetical protein J5N97_021921 [Dioscorea zingiberensis]|uniref:Dirigent protein n=1 Tax=Dioscorea zingiberensis TaxID=325984 RepID=A0A9D5C9T7_9LILI|nr:hypothetical protein J5N97_021921 [Dioscorea zingiberensis]
MDTNHHLLLLFLLFPLNFVSQCHAHDHEYHFIGKEKVTTLHFYVQETLKGDHPSAIEVAGPKDNSSNQTLPFGTVLVIDDPLTEGSDPNSKVVGRAQGLAVSAGQQQLLFVLAVDFGFTSGEFNGSSLSVLSRNPVFETERELAVVGGLGKFRMARGFAKLRTYYSNVTLGVNIIEYTVTVFHYELAQVLNCLCIGLCVPFGEFNGSPLNVLSRNTVLETKRELAIVGGQGKFRMARGFANLRTHYMNATTGVVVIEYNVTVLTCE